MDKEHIMYFKKLTPRHEDLWTDQGSVVQVSSSEDYLGPPTTTGRSLFKTTLRHSKGSSRSAVYNIFKN